MDRTSRSLSRRIDALAAARREETVLDARIEREQS